MEIFNIWLHNISLDSLVGIVADTDGNGEYSKFLADQQIAVERNVNMNVSVSSILTNFWCMRHGNRGAETIEKCTETDIH